MTTDLLQPWPRRKIRYVMFRIKAKTSRKCLDFPPELKALVRPIRTVYQNQDGFIGWRNFPDQWDIGIDDEMTMRHRHDKWWCFGISRFRIVGNPGLCIIDTGAIVKLVGQEQVGEYFFHKGFAREVEAIKGGPSYQIDYAALRGSSEERTSWQR